MVSRAEFQTALDRAHIPVLALLPAAPARFQPNVEMSKTAGEDLSLVHDCAGRLARRFGFPHLAPVSQRARAAVAMAADSLERRLARALASASVLEGDSLALCIDGMHTILDAHRYPRHDRFGAMAAAAWDALAKRDPEFAAAPEVWPSARLWGSGPIVWLRSRYLAGVQAVMFHAQALEASIAPCDPSPGQSASAEVVVRVIDPEGLRVLRWPAAAKPA
jgi:hypothetical protein